jgi:hypothetical protein
MGFLKKFAKKAGSPASLLTGGQATIGQLGNLDSIWKNKGGPPNPFANPNLDYLLDPTRYGDVNKPLGSTEGLYDSIISAANGRGGADDELMNTLLQGIDQDTNQAVGSAKLDFLDRGLGGPGQISDIEGSTLNSLRTNALQEKNKTRAQFTTDRLDRLMTALSTKATAGSSALDRLLGLKGSSDQAYATGESNLWNAAEARKEAGKRRSWLGRTGDAFGNSFGTKLGEEAGSGGGNLFAALLGG